MPVTAVSGGIFPRRKWRSALCPSVRKEKHVEINPEKKTNLTNVRSVLITFAVLSGLILLLVIVLLIFRARIIKRRRDEVTKRANML